MEEKITLTNDGPMQALRFILIGALSTLVYFVVTVLLTLDFVGMQIWQASLVAFASALIFSFCGHAWFTFKIQKDHLHHGRRYLIASVALAILFSGFAQMLVNVFYLPDTLSALVVSILYPVSSFLMHSTWSFAHRK